MWVEVRLESIREDVPLYLVHEDGTESDINYITVNELRVCLANGSVLCKESVSNNYRGDVENSLNDSIGIKRLYDVNKDIDISRIVFGVEDSLSDDRGITSKLLLVVGIIALVGLSIFNN